MTQLKIFIKKIIHHSKSTKMSTTSVIEFMMEEE